MTTREEGRERKKTKATSPISPYQMAARNLGREIVMTHPSTIGLSMALQNP